MNKIFFVVPVYKVEKYLGRCAESILAQSYENTEIVLVDDGSPDNCPKLCDEYADKYPNMTLILAHLCSEEHVDVIQNAKNGNVYTDTSGSASYLNNVLEYAVDRIGSEKILFGSDNYSLEFQFGRVALSRISFADKENILYKNARNLFPKAF